MVVSVGKEGGQRLLGPGAIVLEFMRMRQAFRGYMFAVDSIITKMCAVYMYVHVYHIIRFKVTWTNCPVTYNTFIFPIIVKISIF